MTPKELIQLLRQQAGDIARAGLPGWGNTMQEAADAIERLTDALQAERERCEQLRSHESLWEPAIDGTEA